jgi:hypothetical protein
MNIGLIVEGHGETSAVPILIRRIFEERRPDLTVQIPPPLRLSRGKIIKPSELSRAVELMARKAGEGAPLLIVIDADDDCPAELGPQLLAHARSARADRELGVVVAQREFEAWYLASASSLRGKSGLPDDLVSPPNHEQIRDAKGWLDQRMPSGYSPTLDQPKFAALISFEQARANGSFLRFERLLLRMADRFPPPAPGPR